jgi:glycosyltransferase involved in cell wall biosynthesis
MNEHIMQRRGRSTFTSADRNGPLVSVVIPCYKQAQLLPEAIESVLQQTHAPVELVVVDDGSPEGVRIDVDKIRALVSHSSMG